LALVACGGGGASTPNERTSTNITGNVFASFVNGATVSVYATDPQGQRTGSALDTKTTDMNGQYTLTLSTIPAGPVIVEAEGGKYVSEADNSSQTLGKFSVLLSSVSTGSNTAHINPITNTAVTAAQYSLANDPTLDIASALNRANKSVLQLFGLSSITSSPSAIAGNPAATSGDAWLLAAMAGTLEQLRADSKVTAADLYKALQEDAADGNLTALKAQSLSPLAMLQHCKPACSRLNCLVPQIRMATANRPTLAQQQPYPPHSSRLHKTMAWPQVALVQLLRLSLNQAAPKCISRPGRMVW